MKIDDDKFSRQVQGGQKWKTSKIQGSIKNGHGTLVYPTGFGKTFTTLLICSNIIEANIEHDFDYTFHITVPSVPMKEQWEDKILDYFDSKAVLEKYFKIRVINTVMGALERVSCYMSILDEIHEYVNEDRQALLRGDIVMTKFLLGLTATYKDRKEVSDILDVYCPVVDYITEEEAIEEGWLSNFIEYNLGIDLKPDERKQYEHYSESITELLQMFGDQGFSLSTKCLGGGKDERGVELRNMEWCRKWAEANGWKPNLPSTPENNEINKNWSPFAIIMYAKSLMAYTRKRKELLYNSNTKLDCAVEVLKKFNTLKTICFSQSTDFADELCDKLKDEIDELVSVAYHSNLQTQMLPNLKTGKVSKHGITRLKKRAIELFRSNVARIMCTASALDRGFDENDIDLGLTTSGTSNPIQYKQRGGRVKRVNKDGKYEKALLINIYFKHTKDQEWLTSRQYSSIHEIINVNTINEIKYEIK